MCPGRCLSGATHNYMSPSLPVRCHWHSQAVGTPLACELDLVGHKAVARQVVIMLRFRQSVASVADWHNLDLSLKAMAYILEEVS
eukprot:1062248-Rhodomonas_salina.1